MVGKNNYWVLLLIIIVLSNSKKSYAQEYRGNVGARFGYGIGITGTYNLQNNQAIEFLLRYGYHGVVINKPGGNFQALYQKHWEIRRSNFTVFVGAGPSIGAGKKNNISKQVYFALGISPQIGFDYTARRTKLPLIIALDYKPTFNVDFPLKKKISKKVETDFSYYEIAFSIKFGLKRIR